MRVLFIAVVWLTIVCRSSVAQDKATQDEDREAMRHQLSVSDAGGWYPHIVRTEHHTLIFPVLTRYDDKLNSTESIPFLLAVEHTNNLSVEVRLDSEVLIFRDWEAWLSAITLTARTADGALTAKMRPLTYERDGKHANRPANVQGNEMQFVADDMPAEESLDFDLNNGGVFVIALGDGSRRTSIRQLRVDMFDLGDHSTYESWVTMRVRIAAWWWKIERDDVKTISGVGSQTRGDVAAGPVEERDVVSQQERHTPGSSAVEDKASPDQRPAGSRFIEFGGRSLALRGPFVVDVGRYALVFRIFRVDTTGEYNVPLKLEDDIPFLLAVKHERTVPVISTIRLSGTNSPSMAITGSLLIDKALPLDVYHICAYARYAHGVEEIQFVTNGISGDETLEFDLKKGRVFVVSVDGKTKRHRIEQLRIDVFDPKTIHSADDVRAIDKQIAGVVSWWKSLGIPGDTNRY